MRTTLQQLLIDCGYKEWYNSQGQLFHETKWLYQKKVFDDKGIQYFINAYWYPEIVNNDRNLREGIQWEVQFNMDDGETFEVIYSTNEVDKAERMFHTIWSDVRGIEYYERYEEDYK